MGNIKIFEGIIPENACESIIQEGLSYPRIKAGIGKDNELSRGRSTTVAFINNAFLKSYIYQLVFSNYDTEITEIEDLQFAAYNVGDYYGRHKDADDENKRVLSVSVQLSNPSSYKGGELIVEDTIITPKENRVVIFGPGLIHKVNEFEGQRVSLSINPWNRLLEKYK